MRFLQTMKAIVIDPHRCPETVTEFLEYEYPQDKEGNFISEYPDKNDHHISAVRYGLNLHWIKKGAQ
jgi:phage terminase large subunit